MSATELPLPSLNPYAATRLGGAGGAPATVNTNELVTSFGPSLTTIVIVEVPSIPGNGVTVIVLLLSAPPKTMLLVGTSAGLDDNARNCRLPAATWPSPTVKLSGPTARPRNVFWSAIWEMEGGVSTTPQSGNIFTSLVVAMPT